MCDTLCARGSGRMYFAKNSDRPPGEVQLLEGHGRRRGGGRLRTQYLELPDPGGCAVVGSRPSWLWGFEHGVNEHRVAIGNERIWTVDAAARAEPALIGMDLVRLGLERARCAEQAIDIVTGLLERHGQGGVADAAHGEAYFSSFLMADPESAWVLETSARTWAARPVEGSTSISNRISIRDDWARASADVPRGADFDAWRDPQAWTAHADRRLEVTRPAAAAVSAGDAVRALAATLRHHGDGPWGAPGADPADVRPPPPPQIGGDGTGVTVCMHVRAYQATTASLIAELPADRDEPLRAWVAPGSPCVSLFVPIFPPAAIPPELGLERTWRRFAALRERVEAEPEALAPIRRILAPVEAELWDEADRAAGDRDREARFAARASRAIEAALHTLEAERPGFERPYGADAGRP
jgi:secernin